MVDTTLDEDEKAIIRAFGSKIELTEKSIKDKINNNAKLITLLEKEIIKKIEPVGSSRSIKLQLTETGQRLKEQLKEVKPKRKPVSKPAKTTKTTKPAKQKSLSAASIISMEDVIQTVIKYFNPHFEKYNRIIEDLSEKVNRLYSKAELDKPSMDLLQFREIFQEVYDNLNIKNNYGDVIPIPIIKQALQMKLAGQFQSKDLNAYLLKLEEKRIIDLQIASDPSKVPNSQEGIQHPQRGTIYYVTWRKNA